MKVSIIWFQRGLVVLLWWVERTFKCTLEPNICLIMYGDKPMCRPVAFPGLSIKGKAEINTEEKKKNGHKWLIKRCQLSNLYQTLLSQKAAAVFLRQRGCNLFGDQNSTPEQCQTSKRVLSRQRMPPVLFFDISLLCQGENGPTSCMQDKHRFPRYWCLCGEEMKRRRLIETKSTPLLLRAAILWAEGTCCR